MYFNINKTGCNERKGLVEVRYDLYLDESDYGYNEHYVQVPVIPEGGYPGKMTDGNPDSQEDYNNWYSSLEKIWRNNPFCCHFCQFEPDVTDEEIIFVGEMVLDMAYKNWQDGELGWNSNLPVSFSSDIEKKNRCKTRIERIKNTDFHSIETVGKYKLRK